MIRQLLVAAALVALTTSGFAQGVGAPPGPAGRGQRPARAVPTRADAPRGTAVLRGMIVTADNASPIRRAQVRVASPDARESRVATTDAQGRFEIRELPAGRYTMTASKGGFVSLQFGQRRPSESGTPIELADAQTIDKITIALPRGSVLGGRVTDEFGEPVANASVTAWRYAYQAGARRMVPAQGANGRDTTDDQGQFRLFGLPPGEYYVSAMLRSGGPEVTDPMGELSGYAATYYPGTTNMGEAQRVTVALAQENTSVNFGLIATRLVRVSGQVMMSNGAPAPGGMVMLAPMSASGGRAMMMQQGGAGNRIDQTGAFRLPNVAPGRYQVQARAGGREFELARMDLVVGTEDVEGLTLVTAAGAVINGTIVSETGEPFDFRAQQLQVSARLASPETQGAGPGGPGGSRVGDDWSFSIAECDRSDPAASVGAARLDVEVGPLERPGHHRYADGIPARADGGWSAGGDVQESDDPVGPRHRRAGQSRPRCHGGGVSGRRKALDVSIPVHQGGPAGSGWALPDDGVARRHRLPGGGGAAPGRRPGRRPRISRLGSKLGSETRTWRG